MKYGISEVLQLYLQLVNGAMIGQSSKWTVTNVFGWFHALRCQKALLNQNSKEKLLISSVN